MEIKFSPQGTGACPICAKRNKCKILEDGEKILLEKVKADNDEKMEIVIYRCPEFEDLPVIHDSAPFS